MALSLGNLLPGTGGAEVAGDNTIGTKYTKDYNLTTITLLSADYPPLDLKPAMIELSYFEDIYNNISSGNILVHDAQGYIEKMGINGSEYLRFVLGKDDSDLKIDKTFRIYKVSNRTKSKSIDAEFYTIHFCTDELLLSEQLKISKSYKNKKIKDMVLDILDNVLEVPSKKYLTENIEDTQGVYSFIIPNFKPFEAINWLSMYAQPASGKSVGSDMIFFENSEGFNFASLQTLFRRPIYFNYRYAPKNVTLDEFNNQVDKQVFNVLGFEVLNSVNSAESISSGVYSNRVMTIDPLLRKVDKVDFNYADYKDKASSLNKGAIVNNLENRKGQPVTKEQMGCFKLSFTNKGHSQIPYIQQKPGAVPPDVFSEVFVSQRKSQLALTNNTRIKLYISGDPNVTVGMTINFDMLSQNPASNQNPKDLDSFYSGKYLITAVRHIVQTASYNTVIEAVKDSVAGDYNAVDNSQAVWKKASAGEI